jgi:hypothetical protein
LKLLILSLHSEAILFAERRVNGSGIKKHLPKSLSRTGYFMRNIQQLFFGRYFVTSVIRVKDKTKNLQK